MQIRSLTLSHFRSHRLTRLAADARPVAIYGPNGSGKTNILEAISLLSPGRGLRRASAAEMARRPESLGWKISAMLSGPGTSHEVSMVAEGGGARQLRIDDKPAPQTRLGQLVRVLWLVPSMDRLWIEGAEGRRRFVDRMTLSFFPEHGEQSLSYDKAMRERNRLLRDGVLDDRWYAALEDQLARAGLAVHQARAAALARLAAAQEGAATAFPIAALTLEPGETGLPESEAEYRAALAASRARDMAAGRTLIGPHRADLSAAYAAKGAPAAECSTGEQKALLISLVLANARALAEDAAQLPILLLDEVAAHLDEDRRAALYSEILALGTQAWMTGTEPHFFAQLGPEAQRLRVAEEGGVSQVEDLGDG
ncbi:DNA replication/repair protein RecF [Poseidonocella sedimentorum]|uniref:DNA replication and repair protein RecF n=1 Tax=Poseidonocella sedimentorum TaxID=871652 RepID=A0A1I6D530_9RHOB|nr:DNA replication/repair protein RecF [Poseidonocella sedimentorum]SFR00555.1 DNA replication and repair protein RecF [Poseidonocella sedimentorum]